MTTAQIRQEIKDRLVGGAPKPPLYPRIEAIAHKGYRFALRVTTLGEVDELNVSGVFGDGTVWSTAEYEADQVVVWATDESTGRPGWQVDESPVVRLLSVRLWWSQFSHSDPRELTADEVDTLLSTLAPRPIRAILEQWPADTAATYRDRLATDIRYEQSEEIFDATMSAVADVLPE